MENTKEIENRLLEIEKTIDKLMNQLNEYSEYITIAMNDPCFDKTKIKENEILNRVDDKLNNLSDLI